MPPVTLLSPWQRHIQRANELSRQYSFAAEILGFYIHVAGFQEELHRRLSADSALASFGHELSPKVLSELIVEFDSFLSIAEKRGPDELARISCELRSRGENFWRDLLAGTWASPSVSDAPGFLALVFLQPLAELLRSRATALAERHTYAFCRFCNRRPVVGVLRQMGEGAARSLICSFCLAEWDFRRLICPACNEENDQKFSVFTSGDFDYIRIECCDTCKTYIKTIDLTKNGHADPIVDELASAPLDLWARDRGYAKLQSNLMGM